MNASTEDPIGPICLTCDLQPECLFANGYVSTAGSYYVLECLGPGIPRVEVRKVDGNQLCEYNEMEKPEV